MTTTKNDATVLVRMPTEMKEALTREAFARGRRITAEINIRLAESLRQTDRMRFDKSLDYDDEPLPRDATAAKDAGQVAREPQPKFDVGAKRRQALTETEVAVLDVFRRLPPEKQLALLSLFK